MVKYTEQVKIKAVRAYLSGSLGMREVATQHGVGFASLRGWVAQYQEHGVDGLKPKKRKPYDADFKIRVLNRIRDDGLSYRQAAAIFGVRRFDQIGVWERAFNSQGVAGLMGDPSKASRGKKPKMSAAAASPPVGPPDSSKKREDLLREVQQLRLENAYLKKVQALVQSKAPSARKTGR